MRPPKCDAISSPVSYTHLDVYKRQTELIGTRKWIELHGEHLLPKLEIRRDDGAFIEFDSHLLHLFAKVGPPRNTLTISGN